MTMNISSVLLENFIEELYDLHWESLSIRPPKWICVEIFKEEWKRNVKNCVVEELSDHRGDRVNIGSEMCPLVSDEIDLASHGGLDEKGKFRHDIPVDVYYDVVLAKEIKILQKFCKSNQKYWKFKRWIKSKEFAEWFYAPENIGGKIGKRNIEKLFA